MFFMQHARGEAGGARGVLHCSELHLEIFSEKFKELQKVPSLSSLLLLTVLVATKRKTHGDLSQWVHEVYEL